jgi:hypothetical protein
MEVPLTPREIETDLWDKRVESDNNNFLGSISEGIYDKRGIIGEHLFPLTIDNESSKIVHRTVATITGDSVSKSLMCGLCPELETFVTLTNWMGSVEERKEKRLEIHREFEDFVEKNDPNMVCRINGNYRLKTKEYFNVLLFRSTVSFETKTQSYYDWERAPFIKRSSETFMSFPSPIFMSSFTPSEDNTVAETNSSYFTAVFSLKNFRNNIATIYLYGANTPIRRVIDVTTNQEIVDTLLDKNGIYLGLFEEIAYKKSNKIVSGFRLVKLSFNPLNGDDFAGHFIAMRMYYNYLKEGKLSICSDDELKQRCKVFFHQILRDYGLTTSMNFDNFLIFYIKSYFVKIGQNWYYKPYIFKDVPNDDFEEFVKYLELYEKYEEKKADIQDMVSEINRHNIHYYQGFKHILDILYSFNYYSKADLVRKINNFVNKNGESAWMI